MRMPGSKIFCLIFLMGVSAAIAGSTFQQDKKYRVIVDLTDIRSKDGNIMISIYNKPETFPGADNMLEQKIISHIPGKSMKIRFEDLSAGSYAIAVLHDENGDREMDFNLIGMPSEGYCFSNNVRPKFRKPRWEEAKFEVKNHNTRIQIAMKY